MTSKAQEAQVSILLAEPTAAPSPPLFPRNQPEKTTRHPMYEGSGTPDDPYMVEFQKNDPSNPMNFAAGKKWFITGIVTVSIFAITFTSSAYSGSAKPILSEFETSAELYAAGISLFVLGFAVGPPVWGPLSELYGRRVLFVTTHAAMVGFVGGTAGARTVPQLLVLRFLAGMFGASPLTNSGGVIADLFPTAERGLAMSIFCAAPFLGPVLAPTVGGFIAITAGWRWVQGVCAIFIAVVWLVGAVSVPETYGPVLLHRRARDLARQTGKSYVSVLERTSKGGGGGGGSAVAFSDVFGRAIRRPWVLLFREPIVLIASVYLAILYGTLYMFLPAFIIVYQQRRGWNAGVGGLAFLGLAAGMLVGLLYTVLDDRRYRRLGAAATPESRLPQGIVGAVALPIGMFAFAWTNGPEVHWAASVVLCAPFGFGSVLVFMACLNYLMDSYTIYAASVLAAGAMLRAFFGAAFPLFTSQMYGKLGIHWASSIPAFLTVACVPFPFIMYRYGAALRMRCKYANEAATLMARLQAQAPASIEGLSEDSPSA